MATPSLYYVYRHIRPDKDEPFYIGIGTEGSKRVIKRNNRNKHWQAVVDKNGGIFYHEIILTGLTASEARYKEIEFIKLYGRAKYDKGGILTNVLEGGNLNDISTTKGRNLSEETRAKMSNSHIGNRSIVGKIYINDGTTNNIISKDDEIPTGWKRGQLKNWKFPEDRKIEYSLARKGKKMNLSDEEKVARRLRAIGNKAASGKIWINNSSVSKYIDSLEEIPNGWTKGRLTGWNTHKNSKQVSI